MATRSGSVDPGLILWLQRHGGLSVDAVADGLEHGSGVLGLAGTADMRQVLTAAEAGAAEARLARDVYVQRLRAGIASMAAAMNGLDGLVFTGGVGENAPAIHRRVVEGLRFLGLTLGEHGSEAKRGDREIGPAGTKPAVLVVASREDLEITRQVRALLAT